MLQTLFTGHTLPLHYIAYVGPILQATRSAGQFESQTVMYIEIGIVNSLPIRHEFIKCDMFGQMTDGQAHSWDIALNAATEQRNQLIAEWEAAMQYEPSQ